MAELSELSRRSGADGREVELDDSNIKGGTLRRSGSQRFNKTKVGLNNIYFNYLQLYKSEVNAQHILDFTSLVGYIMFM